MITLFKRLLRDQSGATAIEYGLIAALVSIVIIGSATVIATGVQSRFDAVASQVK